MSATDISLTINLCNSINSEKHHPQNKFQSDSTDLTNLEQRPFAEETKIKSSKSLPTKVFENSRSSDSGKSSSCSPILLDCSFDSGIAGVLLDSNNMQLHKRIQQCQCILLALERDREYFFTIRNRLSKITNRKKKESNENEFFCNVCCAEINPEDEKTFVKCYVCQKYICRSIKCADWLPKSAQWECELCQSSKESLAQTSSWVADQITFHQEKLIHPPRARSEIYIPISECNDSSIHFESVSQIGANSTAITAEQKLKIREYVEEVVAKLLGGNLDTIAVNQLSKSENYLPNPKGENSHNGRLSRESVPMKSNGHDLTDISETRLRQMIQKIIAETMSLPPLSNGHAVSEISLDRHSKVADNRSLSNGYHPRHRTEHYFEPTIYQDLLATAVLNKIVDKQLNNEAGIIGDDGDGVGGCGDGNENDANEVNANIRHTTDCDQNMNMEKLSTSSGSSVDPRSDCSYPEIEQILNTNDDKSSELLRNSDRDSVMSDYLASHLIPLPDLNAMATESDEDDYMSVTSSAVGDGTWEKNWLFKKKRTTLSGSVTANSVGMLVPDPKEDVRAQIGDKTTDEISDLSELGSDTDDSLDSLRSKLEPINDRLINKHLIGGQNNKMVLDELIERSSMISNTLPNNQDPTYTDTCNEHVIDATPKTEAINDNVTQQTNAMEQKVSLLLQDPNSNTLTASDDNTESVGCIGFSAIEIIEPCPDTPSVVEILAAMALGPMLAVPSGDQPATLTVSDYNAFTDLKELALAEIKARALELTPRNLDVIPEEPGDVTNQTENLTDSHESNSLIDQEKNNTKTENFIIDNNLNSSQISFTISEPEACDTKISNIQLPENFDHAMNEIITNSSTLISTKSDLDNSHLDMDENTVTEELNQMISQEQQASINDKIELVYSKSNIENNEQTSNKTTYEINSGMHLKDETLSVNEKSNNENNINDDYLKENSTQQNVVILDQIESGRSELAESISQEQPFETQQEDNKIISVNHLSETLLEDKSNSTNHHALTLCLEQSVQNLLVKKHNSVEPQTEPNKEISIEEISEVPSSFEISLNDTEDSGLILPEKLSEIPLEYKLDFDKNVIEPIIEEAISFDKTILKQETIETNSEITDVTKNEKSSEISFKDIPNLTYNKTSSVSTEFTNDSVTKEQFGETQIEIDTTDSTLERDIESKIEENTLTKQLAVVDEQIPKETHFETQTEDILNSMNNKDTLSYRENCLQLQREKGTLNQPIESQPDDFSESMNNKESYLSLEPSMQYTNKEDILVEKLVVVDETEQPNEIHAVDTLESIKTEDIFLCLEVNSLTEQPAASDEEMSKDGHLEIHSDKTPDSTNNKVYSIGSALSIEECTSHAQSTDSKTQTSETIPEDVSNFEQEKTMSGEQSNEVYEKMSKDQPTQIPAEETGRMMPAFPKHSVKSISVECPSVEQPAKDNIIVSEEQSKIINEIVSKAQKIETQPGTNSDNIETDDASAEQSTKIWEDSLDFIKKEDLSTKTQNSSKCQNRNVESKTDECTLVKKSNEENSETFPESISIFTNVEPIEQYKSENFSTGLCRSEELKSEKKPSTENVAVNVEENSEVKQPETQADDSLNPISEVSLNFSEHHPEKDFEKSVHCNKTSLASIDPSTQSEMGDGSTADEQSKVGDNLAFIEQTSETLQESTTGAFIETKQNSIGKCTLYEHLKVNGEKISEEHSSEVNTSDSANNETSPGFSKVIVQYKIGDTASHKVSTIIHETISNEMQCETLAENILEFAKNENSYTSQESCVVYRTECSSPAKVVEYITYTYTNENQTENILNSDSLECTSSDPSEVIVEEITDSSETKTVGPLEMTENDDTLICPERIAEYKIDKCTSTERLTAEVEISHNIPENSIESSVESKTKECTSADLSTVLLEKITNNQPFEIQPENNLDSMKNEDTSSYSEHSVESKTEDYTSAVISAVFVGQITNLTETKPEDTLDLMNNDYSSACQERSVESKSEDCISSEHSVVVTVHLENTVESTNNENISPTSEHSAVFIEQITNGQICETQPEKTLNDIENERTSACSEHSVECKTDEVTSVKHSTGVVEQRSEQFSENCPEDTLGSKKNEDTLTCAELSVGSKTAECSSAETLGENALDGMKNEDNSTCICKSKGYTSAEHLTVVDEQITNDQLFETQTQNTLEYMKNEDSSVQDSVAAIEQIANDQLCETEPENTLDSKKNEETSMCPGYSEESKTEECTSVEHSREVAKKNTNEQISGIQTGSPFDCMKKEFSLSEDSAKVAEPIKNKQFSESPPENNLDSMKSKNTHENPEHDLESKSVGYITDEQKNEERMCPGYSEESKTEECTSVEHSIVVDKKNTNEQISGIQTGSPFDCIKKEFSLSEDSAKVAEPIKNEQFSESPPENNLDSMKIKNTHENPEHDLESKNVGYITDEHSVEDVALVTYQQPLEIQPGDALHSTNISSQSEESNSAEHSTVVIEQITKEQPSETQHENTLDSMNKESVCQERSMESKIEKWPSAEVDAQITNQQPSDTQTEDTLHFTKNDSQSEETTVVIEQITNEQPSDIQSKNTLEYTKKEDCSVGPEHSIQLKTGMCTSADFPSVSVEQITNEQPSETKAAEHLKVVIDQITKKQLSETEHKNILDSLKKEDCSVCPQRSMESKLEECPSTGPLVEVVVQITNQQISEILPEDIVQSTKNDSQGEESNSAKHSKVDIEQIKNKQSNSAEHSTVTVEHITNEQPSKTQSKNTLDSMKNGDCLTRPEQSVQLKTEVYTSADPSSVVVEQITNEQPSETNSAVHSIVVIAQITKEQISETQHVNTLDSVKKEVYSVCLERSMASKFEECPSVKDVPQIINQQSGEIQPKDILHSTENDSQNEESNSAEHSTVIVEHITNEQPSEIQHENTLDSMKNGDCLACPEQSMQLKTEVCTSSDPSSVVVEQITNEQPSETNAAEHSKVVVEQITKEQLSKTQHVNTLDSVKKEEHSVCPERSMESKLEECPSTGLLVEVVAQITNEQPSETNATEHSKVVVEQLTNEQSSETQPESNLYTMEKKDCSICPEHSMESKLINQLSAEIQPKDIFHSTENDSQNEESNSAEHSTVIVEHITNEQPSEIQHENTLNSMKNGDCLACPEQSMQLKTEVCTSADPPSVVVEQITNEQPSENYSAEHSKVVVEQITKEQLSETQHVNTLDSVKEEEYSVCPERSMESKLEECPSKGLLVEVVAQITNEQPSETNAAEHSKVVVEQLTNEQSSETQPESNLYSMEKKDCSVCPEHSMESKLDECPSIKDVPEIINQQSAEIQPKDILHSTENDSQNDESNAAEHSTVIVEHISNEQPSEIQHENTLDSMKNGDCLACPEQSMQLKTEVCTSADLSSVVVEQIINEQPSETYSAEHSKVVVEQITKEQLSKTQHVNTLDSVKKEEHSVCPERSMESKLEECPSTGLLVEVVAQITNEQPSETNTAEHSKVVVEQLTNEQSSETQPESNLYSMEKKDCSVCPEHSMESKLINQQSAEIQPKDILHSTENDSQNEESNSAEHSTVIVEHISNEQPSEIQHENTLDSMKNGDCLACPEQSMQLKTEVCTSADLSSVVVEQIINEQPSETYSAEHSKVVVEQITKEQLSKTQHVNTLDSVKKEEHSVCPERSMESKLEECPSTGLLVEVVAQITNEQPSETNTAEHSKVVVEQLTNEQSSETQPESNLYSMEKKDCSVCPEHSMESKLINQQSAEIQPKDILHSTENDSQNEESNAAEHSTVIVEHISNEQPSEIQHENTLDSMKNGDCLACPEQSMQLKTEVCTSSDRPSVVVEQITNVLPSENQREVSSAENSAVVVEQINNNQLKKIHCLISPEHMAFKTKLSLTCSENEEEECISDEDSAEATEQILKYDFSETQPEMILNSKRNDDTSKCQEGDVKFNIMECSSDEYLTKDVEEIINVQTYETQMESTIHSTKNESKTEGTVVVARTTNDQISDTKPENTLEFTKNEDTSCAKQSAKSKKDHCTSVKHSLVIVEQISNELISQIQQKNEDSSASLESKTEECTSAENATAVIEEITSEQTAEMQMQNTLEATKNENCSTCTKCGIESKPEEFTSPDPLILVVETIINELISETQHKSYNSYLETKAEECTSAKDSVAVIERIASEIISETQPQATLKSMKNVDCSISSEHSVEFQTEECTSSEHSALVFEQSTNDQPSETQLEDILHSVERTSAEHSTIFIEEFKRKQASNNQPENSLDSSAEFVQQATNEQSSETQLKNSLDSIKNTDSWTCPETKAEKNFEESAEVTEQIENFQLLATQEENILVSKKYDGDLESKSKECTSDEFSSEVVQQILNEQPSENKLNNTLHSLKNEDFSACPEESEEYTFETQPEYTLESINNEYSLTCLETKTKECTSAEDTAIVFEQIKIKQNCKHQLQNTLDSMKNADCAGFPERSLESKSEECTSTEHSSIITELITNAQPSETKPENTIESMKNADCMESLEPKTEYLSKAQKNDILHSAESKTEKCASAKDSTVIAKQNNCEQPSETQLKNTLDSIKNEDYAACPERTFKSKTEEHTFADPSAVDFDQVKIEQTYETQLHSTLESMKNYDFSECHERFLESKAKVYSVEESKVFDEAMSKDQPIKTKHEHITDVIFETTIDNGESPVACSEISMRCSIGEDDINDESTVLNEQIFDGQSSRVQRQGISDSKKNEISSISVHSSTQSKTKKYTSVQHPIVYGKNSKEQFFEIQSNGTSDCMRNEDSPEQIAESKIEVINKTITEKQYFAAQTNEPSSDIPKPSLEAKTKENTTNKHTVVLTETQSEVTLDYTLCTKSSEETKTEGSMSVCLQPKLESKADECPLEKQSTVDDKIIAKQQDFTKMPAQNTSDFLELNLESKFEECYGAKQSEAVNIQTLEVITHSSNNETSLDSTHNTLPKIEGYTSAVHPTVAVLKTFEDHQFKVEMEPNDTIPNDILHEIPLKGISDLMNIKTLTISSKIQYKIRESTSDNKSIVCEEIIKQSSKNEPELKQIILKELSSDVLTESISDSKSCMQPTIENNGTENKQEIVILDYTHNDISLTCQPKAENSNSSETQIESSELFSKGNSLKIQDLIVNSTPKEYTIKKQRKLSDTNSKDQSSESQAENKKQISKEQISEIPFGDTLDSTIHESSSENSVQYKAKECTSKTVNDKRFSKKHRSESQTKTNETISNERSTFHDETYLKDQILETQTEINNKIPNVQSSEMSFEGLSISTSSEASTKSSASGLQYKTEESTSVEQIAVLDETISKDLTSESEPETNKIISREESSEKLIDNFSTDPANNKKVLESSSEIHTKKEACLESKPINNNETQIESNLCQIPDVIDLPKEITTLNVMEDYVLFNDTPSITRQYTVVNIEGKEKRTEECHNKLSNSLSASEPNETSDQLSNDSKPYDESLTNTVEEYINNNSDDDHDGMDNLALNINKTTTIINTTITTTTTTTTTTNINNNSSTAINYKENNANPNNNINYKQHITNTSGYTEACSSSLKSPYNLLTSAVQNKETTPSNNTLNARRLSKSRHNVLPIINHDQLNVKILIDDDNNKGDIDGGQTINDDNKDEEDDDDVVALFRHFVPGSIAEREYKKWYNAVEMPNNPYAPEALKRRISGSQERFIDLPNISPIKDLNPLELLNTEKLDSDENATRESDYKRYSRDYYINSSLTTPQMSPARDVSVNVIKDNQEPSKEQLPTIEIEAKHDLYKAIPAQVEESGNLSSMEYTSERSIELETNDTTTTTTSDSDTIKMYDIEKEQKIHNHTTEETTNEEDKNKEGPTSLAFSKTESCGNVITPTRGTTPMAFKFLQPKRKLLEPSQVLSVDDDDEQQTVTSPLEKPVIEAEVAKALPSVKALARAFLMTTNSTQPEKLWLRKARTLSQGSKKRTYSPKRSLDIQMRTKQLPKLEDDITITSDLSSLETDSSSVGIELSSTPTDLTISAESSSNDAPAPGNISPVPVREGVLKNNIAFFENLKNK